jgi:hypothetical protein
MSDAPLNWSKPVAPMSERKCCFSLIYPTKLLLIKTGFFREANSLHLKCTRRLDEAETAEALAIRLNALKELFLLHGSYAPRDPKEAEQFGIKVVVVDIPRPPRNAIDVRPSGAGENGESPADNDGDD